MHDLYPSRTAPGAALLRSQNALWTNGGQLYAPPVR